MVREVDLYLSNITNSPGFMVNVPSSNLGQDNPTETITPVFCLSFLSASLEKSNPVVETFSTSTSFFFNAYSILNMCLLTSYRGWRR